MSRRSTQSPTGPTARLSAALTGRYRLGQPIGEGGMATVYLATDLRHGRQVALKVLAPEIARLVGPERFEAEIRITANLNHPGILPLFDSGSAADVLFYVMPYIEGGSLRDRLGDGQQLPIADALRIASAVAGALDHAHAHGVVHRDIKPENVLLGADGIYLADFGIALTLTDDRRTAPGIPIGTPAYMSPEQIAPDGPIDGRADVYALGCLTYEMLGGRPPFRGHPAVAVKGHLSDQVPPLAAARPGFPPAADQVLGRALAKDRNDRFPRATEFTRALEAACTGLIPPAEAPPRPPWRLDQEIRFCRSRDDVSIAWATSGDGRPMVKAANWFSHLEFDAASPIWEHWWHELSARFRLIRYDERASGLSQWEVDDISFESWVGDLEAVVDAAGLDQFTLLGISKGGAIAVAYAVRHPERVKQLVIYGAFGRRKELRDNSPAERERIQLEIDMVRLGWGGKNAAFRQAFTTMFFPDALPEESAWFNELQRISASPENAARILMASREIDVLPLAPLVKCPALVLHSQDDARVPFKEGRLLASVIPGARFVSLPSRNHVPLLHEPAWPDFLRELDRFTGTGPARSG